MAEEKEKVSIPKGLWLYLGLSIFSLSAILSWFNYAPEIALFLLAAQILIIYGIIQRKEYTPLILAGTYFIMFILEIIGTLSFFIEEITITKMEIASSVLYFVVGLIWIKYFYDKKDYFTEK